VEPPVWTEHLREQTGCKGPRLLANNGREAARSRSVAAARAIRGRGRWPLPAGACSSARRTVERIEGVLDLPTGPLRHRVRQRRSFRRRERREVIYLYTVLMGLRRRRSNVGLRRNAATWSPIRRWRYRPHSALPGHFRDSLLTGPLRYHQYVRDRVCRPFPLSRAEAARCALRGDRPRAQPESACRSGPFLDRVM
jgi:hypothetical protein